MGKRKTLGPRAPLVPAAERNTTGWRTRPDHPGLWAQKEPSGRIYKAIVDESFVVGIWAMGKSLSRWKPWAEYENTETKTDTIQ